MLPWVLAKQVSSQQGTGHMPSLFGQMAAGLVCSLPLPSVPLTSSWQRPYSHPCRFEYSLRTPRDNVSISQVLMKWQCNPFPQRRNSGFSNSVATTRGWKSHIYMTFPYMHAHICGYMDIDDIDIEQRRASMKVQRSWENDWDIASSFSFILIQCHIFSFTPKDLSNAISGVLTTNGRESGSLSVILNSWGQKFW